MHDLRFAARILRKSPGFTLIAASLLAAGIGANTVIFSAFDAVLLRRLPVRNPGELVRMVQKRRNLPVRSQFAYAYYRALREHAATLSTAFGAYELETAITDPGPPKPVRVHFVSPEYFDALGVSALYGRTLTPADDRQASGAPPAVLSYDFWRERFAGDPRAIGRMIAVQRVRFVIVGVMQRGFNGISAETTPEVRVPFHALLLISPDASESKLEGTGVELAGRVKPGVDRARAQAECLLLWRRTMEPMLKANGLDAAGVQSELRIGMELEPLERGVSILRTRFGNALELLIASSGLLQLLVCVNLAGLLLARSARRREEIAIRLSLGATRGRLVRQMLAESGIITAIGAGGGALIAWAATPLLISSLPPIRDLANNRLALTLDMRPDVRVLAFSIAVSVLTIVLFGLAPSVSASRTSLESVLRGARASGGWRRIRGLLVFQIALSTLLLCGAGLLARSLEQLRAAAPGFDREHLVGFTLDPSLYGYKEDQISTLRQNLTTRVRGLPSVVSVATASRGILRGSGFKTTVAPSGQHAAEFLNSSMNRVSPEYFDTLGVPILEGRALTAADLTTGNPVHAIVNQTFARVFFPGVDPIGRRFAYSSGIAGNDYEIAGVAKDTKYRSLREPPPPTYFLPETAENFDFVMYVRTRVQPESLIQPVRQALAALDPALPFSEIETMAEEVDASSAPERLTAMLGSIFALLAAVLAGVGMYGLFAFAVADRRREIGIRMAVGAAPGDIGRMITGEAAAIAAGGLALGLGGAILSAPLIQPLLYGVAPKDPRALIAASLLVCFSGLVAAAIPAVRAARLSPGNALRL